VLQLVQAVYLYLVLATSTSSVKPSTARFRRCWWQVVNKANQNKNPAKDFCWWDLGGVCLSVCLSVQW